MPQCDNNFNPPKCTEFYHDQDQVWWAVWLWGVRPCVVLFPPPRSPTWLQLALHRQTPEYPHGDGSCPGPCDCGTVPCGEYLWDHRNDTLTAWMVNDFVLGPTGLGNANVSGLYFDDA